MAPASSARTTGADAGKGIGKGLAARGGWEPSNVDIVLHRKGHQGAPPGRVSAPPQASNCVSDSTVIHVKRPIFGMDGLGSR